MSAYVTEARRRWPTAVWIIGQGPYASVAHCDVPTVMLFSTLAEAETARQFIDDLACGHACTRRHEVIDLVEAA